MRSTPTPLLVAGLVLATLFALNSFPQLTSVLLLVFSGVILAVLLDAATQAMQRILPGGRVSAYAATLTAITLVFVLIALLIGPRIAQEMPRLVERVPEAWDSLRARLNNFEMLRGMFDETAQPIEWVAHGTHIFSVVSSTFGGIFNVFVVIFVGIYAAASPRRYLSLGRDLVSRESRDKLGVVARELAHELRLWLLGRGLAMAIVGIATGIGLFLMDVSLAFTLGLWAGLVSFVPYIGPLIGVVPALLIAAVESLGLAGWVLSLYIVIQAFESMVLTPLIQQRAIALPPVVLISAQLIGGVLMGPLGVLLAAPMVLTGAVTTRVLRTAERSDRQPADECAGE